ncbi:hypothetical protein GUJ93_ZPchr0015g6810 [Zizania palustris]|uniref:Uncharacterized protein n=1 Tax=Zizania palustris TaxID=103762 RepID=A0A8J5VSW0_ZIZPA|nr:hypothetical protein GUJ93_ZPchr0015g6810 [Zizania palustris]
MVTSEAGGSKAEQYRGRTTSDPLWKRAPGPQRRRRGHPPRLRIRIQEASEPRELTEGQRRVSDRHCGLGTKAGDRDQSSQASLAVGSRSLVQ